MKLRFYINNKKEKIYTLKDKVDKQVTSEAHYKFIKFKEQIDPIVKT